MTRFAVVDCETTGLDPKMDRIIEVGIVVLDGNGAIVQRFQTLINPEVKVGAQSIHGISDEMLASAPVFADVYETIERILDGCIFVAHNSKFDYNFLSAEYARLGKTVPIAVDQTVCTMLAARSAGFRGALSIATEQLGISHENAHRAIFDAEAAAGILLALRPDIAHATPWAA